jgi:hypothetical protein
VVDGFNTHLSLLQGGRGRQELARRLSARYDGPVPSKQRNARAELNALEYTNPMEVRKQCSFSY